jgi:hypothetical protein
MITEMAMQRLDVQLEDDLTGGPADETVVFGIDGRSYEIDLSTKHAADLRKQLARFIEHARTARTRRPRGTVRTTASRERSHQIRAWAQAHGYVIAAHGRLPRDVVAEYEREGQDGQQAPQSPRRRKGTPGAKLRPAGSQAPGKAGRPAGQRSGRAGKLSRACIRCTASQSSGLRRFNRLCLLILRPISRCSSARRRTSPCWAWSGAPGRSVRHEPGSQSPCPAGTYPA